MGGLEATRAISAERQAAIRARWATPLTGRYPTATEEADYRDVHVLLDALEATEAEREEHVRAHAFMVKQFQTMRIEKEHGWREAEKFEARAEVAEHALRAVRLFAESKAITARALGEEDRPWLDLLILLEHADA